MTGFEKWQRTRIWCADLEAAGMGACFDKPTPGYAYDGGFIVENDDPAAAGGKYFLVICNEDWTGDDLGALEAILFREWVLPHSIAGATVGQYGDAQ